ncbi:MAG TPA: hypothetical protein VNC22_08370, partial [Sporichthya sp.]|nr:hypothetical protein [Sporichthya sp.]
YLAHLREKALEPVAAPAGFPTVDSGLEEIAAQIHKTAVEHGWWEAERNVGEVMMLMVSELSEAFEHYRNGRGLDEIFYHPDGKIDGVPVELGDCLIRILDFCHHHRIPLMGATIAKMRYNEGRPYRHGGKRC